jgi:hypothetical protein
VVLRVKISLDLMRFFAAKREPPDKAGGLKEVVQLCVLVCSMKRCFNAGKGLFFFIEDG